MGDCEAACREGPAQTSGSGRAWRPDGRRLGGRRGESLGSRSRRVGGSSLSHEQLARCVRALQRGQIAPVRLRWQQTRARPRTSGVSSQCAFPCRPYPSHPHPRQASEARDYPKPVTAEKSGAHALRVRCGSRGDSGAVRRDRGGNALPSRRASKGREPPNAPLRTGVYGSPTTSTGMSLNSSPVVPPPPLPSRPSRDRPSNTSSRWQ